jgi:nucleoside phosphorylase/outer membrane protein TolC
MHILLCAATSVEARACKSGVARAGKSTSIFVLQTGMGFENAERALRNYLSENASKKPSWIISTGFAGSRKSSIGLGDFILASAVNEIEFAAGIWADSLKRAQIPYQLARVSTVQKIMNENSSAFNDQPENRPLEVVDMESAALAKLANEFSIPFQVVRLMSDTLDQPIPNSVIKFSSSFSKGIFSAFSEPKKLARFIGQTMNLPGKLTSAWERLSRETVLLFILSSTVLGFLALTPEKSFAYSVEDYLQQVEHSHDGYHAMEEDSAGANAASKSADLIFKPQVFSELQYTYDPRDTHSPELYGDKTIAQGVSTGFREQTPWGIQLQLSLDYTQNTLLGETSPLITRPTVTNLYVVPVFNWSVWQNFGGRLDRANQRMQKAQSLAQSYGSDYGARAILVEAEGRYWKLASLREVMRLQRESLVRARSVMNLDSRKAKQRLIDSGDTLLSEAAVEGKELELKSMLTEERSAARAFNASRGIDSDQVAEDLRLPTDDAFAHLQLPERKGSRGDLKVAEQQSIASEAGYQVAHEKLLPSLSVFGSIFALGLNFSMPLDLGLTSEARSGYAKEAEAAELNFRRKQFEQENDWQELQTRFQDNLERLQLAVKLEDLQRRKFEDANRRRKRAMTVAFQVFQYELDYLAAAQTRLQIEGTLLGLRAQAKLYAESNP